MQEWTKDVPAAWATALRELSPVSDTVPWLALRWFPMRRNGQDVGRWLLSECVPEAIIPDNQRDIVDLLRGPKPSSLPVAQYHTLSLLVNDYQWTMYRDHRVWARELWIIQGDSGGHATHFQQEERDLLRAKGLPDEPPAVGALPYAPFDGRVIRAMQRRNRLIALGNDLDALRRSGRADVMKEHWAQSQRAFRTEYLSFLDDQVRELADLNAFVTRKAENRDCLPTTSRADRNAAARLDEFLETGELSPA